MEHESRTQGYTLLALAVFTVAVAARLWSLHWSPLPSTLDGFEYVSFAEETIRTASYPLDRFRADSVVFTTVLTVGGLITGERPLLLAQPLVAITGAAACLTAVGLTRRVGQRYGWGPRRTLLAGTVAGFGLAVDGLYVRRSGTTDEEALVFLLLPLCAIAVHRLLSPDHRDRRWLALAVLLLVTVPLLHTFGSLLAGLVVTGLLGAVLANTPPRRRAIGAVLVVAGFWGTIWAYYTAAGVVGLTVPYVDRVTAYPGLFVAWLIVLLVGVAWLQRTGPRRQRLALAATIGGWFLVLSANAVQSVFPGTQTTAPTLVAAIGVFAVPVALAHVGLPAASRDRTGSGVVVLVLLLGPVIAVNFSLTAALTPAYFDTMMRSHIFVHFAVFVLAGIGVGSLLSNPSPITHRVQPTGDGRMLRRGLAVCLVGMALLSALITLPVAAVHLDTLAAPAVTSQSQFGAASFTAQHTTRPWTTDDPLERVGSHMYPGEPTPSQGPVTSWLQGGSPPQCPTLTQASWTTTGAHLFPAASERLSPGTFDRWQSRNDVVYSASGLDSVVLVRPQPQAGGRGC